MQTIIAAGLVLEPLTAAHAEAMFQVLADPQLCRHLDEAPPATVEDLRCLYARRESRQSPDGKQLWLNWVVCVDGQGPAGYVQATVTEDGAAWVAFVLAGRHWGLGLGFRATNAMLERLQRSYDVHRCMATAEIANHRSIRLLERLGFQPATPSQARPHALSATERLFVRNRSAPGR